MIQVSCCSLFYFCQPPGAGAFSGGFTTNLARQCRAFSRALKIEKLKAPLFRGPEGAGATNDWCITWEITQQIDRACTVRVNSLSQKKGTQLYYYLQNFKKLNREKSENQISN